MKILAVDTSQPTGRVAVGVEERAVEEATIGAEFSHLIELVPAVEGLLDAAGTSIAEINRVALVSGPGSFTGLRVGLAFVKGLFAARRTDIVTMTALELLAVQSAPEGGVVCTLLDARRDEVYAALYSVGAATVEGSGRTPPLRAIIEPEAVALRPLLESLVDCEVTFAGSGAARYEPRIRDILGRRAVFASGHEPSMDLFCRLAPFLSPVPPLDVPGMEPFYIRETDAVFKPLKRIGNNG